jgi:hypothetical protein
VLLQQQERQVLASQLMPLLIKRAAAMLLALKQIKAAEAVQDAAPTGALCLLSQL